MVDLETRWFEIIRYNDKQSDIIENLVEQTWLFKYPRPAIIMYCHGN